MKLLISGILFLLSASVCFSQVDSMIVELGNGTSVSYVIPTIQEITFSGNLTDVKEQDIISNIIRSFTLRQNYPNPFNPSTTIEYEIPKAGLVSIHIFDISGRLIRTLESGNQNAGLHVAKWNGCNDHGQSVATGAYFCKVRFNDSLLSKKLLMLK